MRGAWSAGPGALAGRLPLLDDLHAVHLVRDPEGGPEAGISEATLTPFVRRAVARGTLVHAEPPLAQVAPLGLTEGAGSPGDLAWDLAAVGQRRSVLAPALTDPPSVSVVVATRRPHLLPRVGDIVARQTYPRLELVVVVHGGDPDALPAPDVPGVEVRVLAASSDASLGRALQLGSEAASGDLLTKVDDDDHYGPDHVLDLVLAHRYSGATIVGKSTTLIHLEDLDATVRRVFGTPESFVHRVAGGTILLAREDLADLGGWADVPRAVDSALMRSARQAGARIYRPHDLGYVYVRHRSVPATEGSDSTHTWAAGAGHFLVSAREQWLGLLRHPDLGTV